MESVQVSRRWTQKRESTENATESGIDREFSQDGKKTETLLQEPKVQIILNLRKGETKMRFCAAHLKA